MTRKWLGALVASLAVCGALGQPALAATIGFDPDSQTVALGSGVQVGVVFSDLGSEVISAYDLDITYDPGVVDATGVLFTTALGDEFFLEVLSAFDVSTAGIVDLAQVSLLSDAELAGLQPGDSVTVATLLFASVGVGTSELGFVFDAVNDVKGRGGAILSLFEDTGSITVEGTDQAPVPEPSAALLFAVGAVLVARRSSR